MARVRIIPLKNDEDKAFDPSIWAWAVRSFTDCDRLYLVSIDITTGDCRCECMDASTRRNKSSRLRRPAPDIFDGCKHVRAVLRAARQRLRERS